MTGTDGALQEFGVRQTNILIPLPDHDFEPSESAYPWQACMERGCKVTFSTKQGSVAEADHRLLKGLILDPLGTY